MPLTNTSTIHEDWSAHHQPTSEGAMRSRVDILHPVGATPSPTWGQGGDSAPSDNAARRVPARINALSTGSSLAAAGQALDTADYLVQVPVSTIPSILVGEAGHRVRVTENPGSPQLVGRIFKVVGIQQGTEAFNWDLVCREHTTQRQGGTGGGS